MVRTLVCFGIVTLALVSVGGLLSQDAKKDGKARGSLPPNFGKLGLSEEQKQKIYTIQSDYKAKIDVLEKQLKDLKKKELDDMNKVLTADQRTQLRKILTDKVGGDDDSKKPSK